MGTIVGTLVITTVLRSRLQDTPWRLKVLKGLEQGSVTQVELWPALGLLERKAGSSGRAGRAVPVLRRRGKSYGPGLPLTKPTDPSLLCLGLQARQTTSSSPGNLPQVLSSQSAHGLTLVHVTRRLPAARHGPLSSPRRRCFGPGSCSTKIKPEMIPNHFTEFKRFSSFSENEGNLRSMEPQSRVGAAPSG